MELCICDRMSAKLCSSLGCHDTESVILTLLVSSIRTLKDL
jgi:hypothetical protein